MATGLPRAVDKEPEPTDYWLATLPEDTPLPDLVRLAKMRWRIEHDYRELRTALGLDHVAGRTFTGWHRHVTLVSAAPLSITLLRTSPKRLRRPEPPRGPARAAGPAHDLDRHLHRPADTPSTARLERRPNEALLEQRGETVSSRRPRRPAATPRTAAAARTETTGGRS